MDNSVKPLSIIKKYKIAIASAAAFAVALGCIISFAGNKSDDNAENASLYGISASASSEASSYSAALADNASSEAELIYGTGIYIDDCFIGAVGESSVAESALTDALNARAAELNIDPSAELSFTNHVSLVAGKYSSEAFVSAYDIVSMLDNGVSNYLGESVPVNLSVCSVLTATETVVIDYDTKTIYTDALENGKKSVVTKGYNGEGVETTQIVSIDGIETARNVLSLDITTPAKNAVVRVGTRSGSHSAASVAEFVKPYDGVVTSQAGPRWGRIHKGIDIAGSGYNCNGAPIVAACDGVVIRADWYGTYGKCIIIDHGNGVETLYAHLSSFSVSVGDVVSAGEKIGKIGSTGNTTGPHLHFEVHVDGECVNPLLFVEY